VSLPRECHRLIEVDFPIAAVSAHSAREKSIRHGHPSTLHLWWARRPLAACRAVLMGLLLPDPCDPHCPAAFKEAARKALAPVRGAGGGPSDEALRKSLLGFIADFSNWDSAANPTFLETARALVQAAYPDGPPLVVDPFAGGGSIPLEALRVGCETFASDLNPVACLILKVLLEDIPRHGRARIKVPMTDGGEEEVEGLAEAVRRVGALVKMRADKELKEFYPPDSNGARPIAYLWARTVRCEAPKCGAEIPLARSFWLSKKAGRRRALRYRIERPKGGAPEVVFEVFEPRKDTEVPKGTVSRGNATCPACGTVLRVERVRAQLSAQRGGADVVFDKRGRRIGGPRLLAVVTLRPGEQGRHYRLPTEQDYGAVRRAAEALAERTRRPLHDGLSPIPGEPFPQNDTRAFTPSVYGMRTWGDLFTARQKLALVTLSRAVRELPAQVPEAVRAAMALVVNRCADRLSTVCRLDTSRDTITNTYARQALPIVWDYFEGNPLSEATGGYDGALEWVAEVIEAWPGSPSGQSQIADAMEYPLPDDAGTVWFTDPPYYDAVPYADLSDFFFVWLKRTLPNHPLVRDPFNSTNLLTPKTAEIVQNEAVRLNGQVKDRAFFEDGMARAFREGRRVLQDDGIAAVVFAHKTTEGWEALLSGLVRAGWVVTASWPITTEMGARLRARESAALSASIHLVLRPRPENADVGYWDEIMRELPRRIQEWMDRLSAEGIRGADLVFSCIGPAMELFSKYSRVETVAGDEEVGLAGNPAAQSEEARNGFLWYIWQVAGRTALQRVLGSPGGDPAGVLEEDARLTALFLWTLQSTGNGINGKAKVASSQGEESAEEDEEEEEAPRKRKGGFTLIYDVARRFAQPLGIYLDQWQGRIIEIEKGLVRLLPVAERAHQLFGHEGAEAMARRMAAAPENPQMQLFTADRAAPPTIRESGRPAVKGKRQRKGSGEAATVAEEREVRREATTLDRIHAGMLLQASGQAAGLRALLEAETRRGPGFLRLANALSALYPKDSEEKRLIDAMLLAAPRR
jgi:putative DNA methylase